MVEFEVAYSFTYYKLILHNISITKVYNSVLVKAC